MFRKMKSIRVRISVVLILVITLAVSIVSVFFTEYLGNLFVQRVVKDQEVLMRQIKISVENAINSINQATWYLFNDQRFADYTQTVSEDDFVNFENREKLNELFKFYLMSPISLKDFSPALYIYPSSPIARFLNSPYINEIGAIDQSHYNVFSASAVLDKKWFKDTANKLGRFNIFLDPGNNHKVYITRLINNSYIYNPDYSERLGVAVMAIDIQKLQEQMEFSILTKNSRVYLINSDNEIVFSNNEKAIGSQIESQVNNEIFDILPVGEARLISLHGEKNEMEYFDLNWGLRLISSVPYSDITESFNNAQKICILISIICIIFAIIVSISISTSISSPIVKLSRTMMQISDKDDMDIVLVSKYEDEVGQLYSSFNRMVRKINMLLKDSYESSQLQMKLELKALQAQINPHFVYNTLDSINWVALGKGERDIARMVTSLAFILRYSISNPDSMVPLTAELEHIKYYVDIQLIRYGGSFDVEYRIPLSLHECLMPKFIIQPLVENAIIHGIQEIDHRLSIIIEAAESNGVITISVTDNGIGADEQVLNAYLRGEKLNMKESESFGIKNVHQRIKLNYGNEFGLIYLSNQFGGTIAKVSIPLVTRIISPQ